MIQTTQGTVNGIGPGGIEMTSFFSNSNVPEMNNPLNETQSMTSPINNIHNHDNNPIN